MMATHVTCPRCLGRGHLETWVRDHGESRPCSCPTCRGTGRASMLEKLGWPTGDATSPEALESYRSENLADDHPAVA